MPIELGGISNENEFYSEHYLTTVFEGDLNETFAAWRQAERDGAVSPNKAVDKAGVLWRRLSTTYREERNDGKRLLVGRTFAHELLDALGYERRSELLPDAEGKLIPVLARRTRPDGTDAVWVVEVPAATGDDFEVDPLQIKFRCEQFEGIDTAEDVAYRRKDTAETAVTKGVFGLEAPPRFVILLSMSQAVLIDRNKWSDSRLLRFKLAEIFGRAEGATVGVMTALLHADSLAPGAGTPLIDRIDEESHRHAYGVSQDLKFALREAIELLGNEAVDLLVAKRRVSKEGIFTGANAIKAEELTTECLRYMYRLLFLFYIESRPELGFAPMKAKAYRMGYSLESLRELELVPLETDEDRNGHFISDTLETLFGIVFEGTPAATKADVLSEEEFTFHPVRARLFSPASIETHLGGLRFRNETMQRIIELLSLAKGERGRSRGRISYAQLGISQLGAVYETLLSFSGFFATEDLIELKPAGKPAPGPLEAAFFAPRRRAEEFRQDEIVYQGSEAKLYAKGTFIYRLAGRNRENSASYYTPEPLARVLVKYALKDLLAGKKADEILDLKIVEPAMGSAAFLVEVVNQLADKYLELKQAELKRRIPHESYALERQKVRAYLADRNVFGVDLNPVAVELGQISLWLDCLHQGGFAPWFEDQVHAGNSLVGARRAAFRVTSLGAKREQDRWYRCKPREISWSGEARRTDEVWHFLLPDPGMSAYDQNVVRPLAPEAWRTFGEWRKDFVRPLDKDEIATVQRLSTAVDALFQDVADRLRDVRREVSDDIAIWPAEPKAGERHVDFKEKIRRLALFHGEGVRKAVSWQRLRGAMDVWCSLWFWPVAEANHLPSRALFLQALDMILTQGVENQRIATGSFATASPQGGVFETVMMPGEKGSGTMFRNEERVIEVRRDDLFGEFDLNKLMTEIPWLRIAMETARGQRFMHFDLEFADVMRERGGFDLVIGNPPWMKPAWTKASVMVQTWPEIGIRGQKAAELDLIYPKWITNVSNEGKKEAICAYTNVSGVQSFTTNKSNFPFIGGVSPNLYQCFVDLSFRIVSPGGIVGLIHQDAHLLDSNDGGLKQECIRRLSLHLQFRNSITKSLFSEVNDSEIFSLNVYRGKSGLVNFRHLCNLFLPNTVDECFSHDGIGPVPAIRSGGKWQVRGHAKRIVTVDEHALDVMFANTADPETKSGGRLLFTHSQDLMSVASKLAKAPKFGEEFRGKYYISSIVLEDDIVRKKRIAKANNHTVKDISHCIIKAPCIYVGNPYYKNPSDGGSAKEDYDMIELDRLSTDFIHRSTIKLLSSVDLSGGSLPWDRSRTHRGQYRLAYREMVQPQRERTLAAAIIPPGLAHTATIDSMSFKTIDDLLCAAPLFFSIIGDYLAKTTQIKHVRESFVISLPYSKFEDTAKHRVLRLCCLTSYYNDLWSYHTNLSPADWASQDTRLLHDTPHVSLQSKRWSPGVGLKSDFARRQALLEIDVLVGQAIGLTVDELIEIYRSQFYVYAESDRNTWFDARGRVVWSGGKALGELGYRMASGKRPTADEWLADFASLSPGEVLRCRVSAPYLDGNKEIEREFYAPFASYDREADYRQAWAFFEARVQKKAA